MLSCKSFPPTDLVAMRLAEIVLSVRHSEKTRTILGWQRLQMMVWATIVLGWALGFAAAQEPITTKRIESFPRDPVVCQPFDWRERSLAFVRDVLNPMQQGEYLRLMWWDDTKIEGRTTSFGTIIDYSVPASSER